MLKRFYVRFTVFLWVAAVVLANAACGDEGAEIQGEANKPASNVVATVRGEAITAEELDGFYQYVKGRLNGIATLKKIVSSVDFSAQENEKTIQKMFEQSPWMIDPTFTQFLTADKTTGTLFGRLAKELKMIKGVKVKRLNEK